MLDLADKKTIEIVHKDLTGVRSAGGNVSKQPIDPKALMRVEKGLKDLPKKLRNELSKTLTPQIAKIINESTRRQAGGRGPTGGGMSSADMKDLAKIIGAELATRLAKVLIAQQAGKGGGARPTGDPDIDKLGKLLGVKLDKMSSDMTRIANSFIKERTGGQGLSPEGAREISKAISGLAVRAVPSSVGQAAVETKELGRNVGSLTRHILTLINEIKEMRKSGGGISGGEVIKVAKNLQEIYKAWSNLGKQIGETSKAYKNVSEEVKGMKDSFSNLGKDIKDLRKQLGAKIRETKAGFQEEPFKIVKKAIENIKVVIPEDKRYAPLMQMLDKLITNLERTDAGIAKEIKELIVEFRSFAKESKKAGVKIEGERSVLSLFKKIEKLAMVIDVQLNKKNLKAQLEKIDLPPLKVSVEADTKEFEKKKKEIESKPIVVTTVIDTKELEKKKK